jgi:hypothetical protein
MNILTIVLVVGVIAFVIGRQLLGEPLRGKRTVLLPLVLGIVGGIDLARHGHQPGAADIGLIVGEAAFAGAIGVCQGVMMRLEARNGTLWGRMPARSLWLWAALVGSHGLFIIVASSVGARIAAGTLPLLMLLGVNRLAQAAVITPRAVKAGIPFAAERDGSSFLGAFFPLASPTLNAPSSPAPRSAAETKIAQAVSIRPSVPHPILGARPAMRPRARPHGIWLTDKPIRDSHTGHQKTVRGGHRSLAASGVQTVATMIIARLETSRSRRR